MLRDTSPELRHGARNRRQAVSAHLGPFTGLGLTIVGPPAHDVGVVRYFTVAVKPVEWDRSRHRQLRAGEGGYLSVPGATAIATDRLTLVPRA